MTLLVLVAAALWAEQIAEGEALQHAENDARALAGEYVVPLRLDVLDSASARDKLDDVLGPRVEQGSLRRIKVWVDAGQDQGTVIYSDDLQIQGMTLPLGEQHLLFASQGSHVEEVRDQYGPGAYPDGTYEVYLGFRDASGTPYIFEAYLPRPEMAVSRGELLRDWLPLVVASLVLLSFAILPLTVQLARRIGSAEAAQATMARRALSDSLRERRRLAQHLHDEVIQDLSGVGLALDSLERRSLSDADALLLDRSAAIVRRGVRELRSVGDDLFPNALSPESLTAAVAELTRGVEHAGFQTTVDVESDLPLDEDTTFLVFRVVREGLLNVRRHAGATRAAVIVRREGVHVLVSVEDDGRGVGPGRRSRQGLGLRLLAHEARDRAGFLQLEPRPGGGSALRVRFEGSRARP